MLGIIDGPNCFSVCGGGFMVEAHIGGMLNPRLALMGDVWLGSRYFDDVHLRNRVDLQQRSGRSTLQYWLTDIIWINGGIGFARLQIYVDQDLSGFPYDDETAARSPARPASRSCSRTTGRWICKSARATPSTDGGDLNNLAFMVGINWY